MTRVVREFGHLFKFLCMFLESTRELLKNGSRVYKLVQIGSRPFGRYLAKNAKGYNLPSNVSDVRVFYAVDS